MLKKSEKLSNMIFDAGGPFLLLFLIGIPIILIVFVIGLVVVATILIKRAIDKKKQEKPTDKEIL